MRLVKATTLFFIGACLLPQIVQAGSVEAKVEKASAETARFWNLPLELNDSNSKLTFELGTTWHTVHGTSKNISGKLWLADPADHTSIRGTASIPTKDLDTDNSLRDSKMRDVMGEEQYKEVSFDLKKVLTICDPAVAASPNSDCKVELLGDLSIRGVTKEVVVEGNIVSTPVAYIVNGAVDIEWKKFGVEDPSILIAKVEDIVSISIQVTLKNPNRS